MKYFLITLLLGVITLSCDNDEICMSSCLIDKIADLSEHHCDDTANITQYRFQNATVYFIDPGHCADDQSYEVINANCEVIGYLWGFAGNTKINGVDFFENAELIGVVWKK